MADEKWSAFPDGGAMVTGDQLVGLRSGENTRLTPVIPAQVQQSAFNFATLAGSSNAFTVTLSPTVTSLTDGMIVTFYSGSKNNTIENPTLSVDGLPAVTIVCWSGGLAPFDIAPSTEYLCIYNASENVFQLTNPSISSANTFEVQSNDYNYATDTGVANAYIANIVPAQLTNNSGLYVVMTALHANSGASTLTVNGVTHPILLSNGAALAGGEILVNGLYLFIYSDALTGFILMNSSLASSPAPSLTNTGLVLTGANGPVDGQQIIYNYSSLSYLGKFVPNALNITMSSGNTAFGWATINLGLAKSSSGGITLNGSSLTSFVADSLLLITGTFTLTVAVTFTTLSLNALEQSGTIAFTAPGLVSLSLPSFLSGGGITLTSAAALTTINMPLLQTLTGTVSGTANSLTTLTLTNLNLIGAYTLTANSLTTLSMPAMLNIVGAFTPVGTSLATINLPLVTNMGAFSTTLAALTTLTLTNLLTITGAFGLVAAALTTLSMPALTTMSSTWSTTMALVTTATFTNLQTVTGAVTASFAALATLTFPAIITFGAAVTFTAANLVTFSMGATLKTVGGNWTMTGMKLDQASVDGILVSLAALDGTGGTTAYSGKVVNLSGGTSATPSATGLAAKAVLVGRGCTVTNN